MKPAYPLLFSLLLVQSSPAQEASVGLPVLGFAFDSTRSAIRPLLGIPGAAILGEPLDPGFKMVSAAIAPQQDFALAQAEGAGLRLVSWSARKVAVLPLDQATASPERIFFSPSGSAAILLSNQSPDRLQILTALPLHPAVEEIDISALSSPLGHVAVSDDGKLVIVAGASDSAVWLFNSARNQVMLPLSGAGAVFSFRRDSHDAAAVSSAGDFYLLRNLDDAPAMRSIAPAAEQSAGAVGLWFTDNGARAFAASATGNITAVDFVTGATQSIACQCAPTSIQPLGRGMFRLTDVSSRPVMVFDGSAPESRVWFVPPDRPQTAQAGGAQ
jgi:hypothetical protein